MTFFLVLPSICILSRDPSLSRKPPETQRKRIRFLERTMVEKNGESTPSFCFRIPSVQLPRFETKRVHKTTITYLRSCIIQNWLLAILLVRGEPYGAE